MDQRDGEIAGEGLHPDNGGSELPLIAVTYTQNGEEWNVLAPEVNFYGDGDDLREVQELLRDVLGHDYRFVERLESGESIPPIVCDAFPTVPDDLDVDIWNEER